MLLFEFITEVTFRPANIIETDIDECSRVSSDRYSWISVDLSESYYWGQIHKHTHTQWQDSSRRLFQLIIKCRQETKRIQQCGIQVYVLLSFVTVFIASRKKCAYCRLKQ